MITKRLFSIIFAMPMAVSSFADSGLSGLSDAADGVGSYLPYVQGVCYVIAAVIAVAGTMSIYLSMQTNPSQIRKRMMMTVGSCMCFVLMATALPQFFGVDGSGSSTGGSSSSSTTNSGTSDGFLASDQGGISRSGIITEIPSFADERWVPFQAEPRWKPPTIFLTYMTRMVLELLVPMEKRLTTSIVFTEMEKSTMAHTIP